MSSITVESSDSVWRVTLTRADKRNALTSEMINGLHAALDEAEAADASVLVLTAEGSLFCAGADIAGYRDAADDPAALRLFTDSARGLCTRLTQSPVVIVAAVNGTALGGGFELVLAADIVLSVESARFGLPELRLGLIPGWGGTQRLALHVGANRAKRAVLLSETFSAGELRDAGLVSAVVADAVELETAVADIVGRLAATAPLAASAAKNAITLAVDPHSGASAGFDRERELLLALFDTDDGREGVRAFVEKRAPEWAGR
ncbi:enoyl-CoA hydratase/isomerase family protein [Microbacterium keratanolyticum]|uniref:enoyl-CoA hydratase/isomerase family protein n=1 Tax=Microbacterium keratanolyticum TaxID=67574 RepID=UPI00363B2D94